LIFARAPDRLIASLNGLLMLGQIRVRKRADAKIMARRGEINTRIF
jgi:hypothetical protein